MSHKETSRSSISSARLPYSSFQLDDEATATTTTMVNEPFSCASCCCFKGCFWCVIGLVYFFILLPTGLLLMIHGYNTTTGLTLGLGVLVVIVSTCGMPGAIFGCLWWRRRRRKQRRQAVFSSNGSTKLVDSSFDVIATESIAPPVV